MELPILPEDTPSMAASDEEGSSRIADWDKALCTIDDVMERIEAIADLIPDMPVFKIVQRYFKAPKELCCTALVDPWVNWCLELESACDKYGVLPFEGAWLDQPLWVIDLFSEIRTVKNQFESGRIDSMGSGDKKSDAGSGAAHPRARSGRQHPMLKAPPANMPHHPRPHG